jgi:hypothetical protein
VGRSAQRTGIVAPGVTWDLAEGRAGGEHQFHTYILLANPQTTAATVTVTYLRENGTPGIFWSAGSAGTGVLVP